MNSLLNCLFHYQNNIINLCCMYECTDACTAGKSSEAMHWNTFQLCNVHISIFLPAQKVAKSVLLTHFLQQPWQEVLALPHSVLCRAAESS